jgi:hypothetical protein
MKRRGYRQRIKPFLFFSSERRHRPFILQGLTDDVTDIDGGGPRNVRVSPPRIILSPDSPSSNMELGVCGCRPTGVQLFRGRHNFALRRCDRAQASGRKAKELGDVIARRIPTSLCAASEYRAHSSVSRSFSTPENLLSAGSIELSAVTKICTTRCILGGRQRRNSHILIKA